MTETPLPVRRRRAGAVALVAGLAILLVLLVVYGARRTIAHEVLAGWLRGHGVASQMTVDGLGLDRASGRIRLGNPTAPDFVVGDAAVTYGLRGLSFEVRSVTLRRPVLRASLHGGRISLGSLDPLVEDFRKKPARPNTPEPRIAIEDGVLLLTTDYGPVRLAIDALLKDGRLISLYARSDPSRLHGPTFDVAVGAATGKLRTEKGRVALTLDAPLASLRAGPLTAASTRLTLQADTPYPDMRQKRFDGAVSLRARATGGQWRWAANTLDAAQIAASLQGQAGGWIGDLRLTGTTALDLRAASVRVGASRGGAIRASLTATDLSWSRKGGDRLYATPRATVLLRDVVAGNLRLSALTAQGHGPVGYEPGEVRATLNASLDGRGGWMGLGPVKVADAPTIAALKRAARDFRITAPGLAVSLRDGAARLGLSQPLQIRADRGGVLTVAGHPGAPLLGPGGGALRLAVHGGGLPALSADIRRLRLAAGALIARGEARVAGSIAPVDGGTLEVSGTLRAADGAVRFTADRCAPVAARRLAFGTNAVERLTGRICPRNGPMFTLSKGNWRVRGEVGALAADAPFLQARIAGASGSVIGGQTAGRAAVTVVLGGAKLFDDARPARFNGVQVSGTAKLANARWSAGLRVATPGGQALGAGQLRHDTDDGRGGLTFDTGSLAFAEGGLQPIALSPLAAPLASPVDGHARFVGRVDWTPDGVTSGGTLSVPDLDFQSAVGKVTGLKGDLVFTSLAPLIAPPDQLLSAESIAAIVPITGVTTHIGLDDKALTVSAGEAAMGGGHVRLEDLRAPLASDTATAGVLIFEGVQLHDLVEASPFGDRVDLDARVSGRVPFRSQGGKVRVAGAELHAIQPGRLSIARQALTGVAATGSVSAPAGATAAVAANDTFTDFAYQAMENLAFNKLDATIASQADGCLGILAHIVGRHDPPQHQEIRLSLFDLIGRKFLSKPLPLPSDTGVDLTLDTTLNLDDLMADYADYRRLRGSPAVQPAEATTKAKPLETPR